MVGFSICHSLVFPAVSIGESLWPRGLLMDPRNLREADPRVVGDPNEWAHEMPWGWDGGETTEDSRGFLWYIYIPVFSALEIQKHVRKNISFLNKMASVIFW